MQMEVMLDSQGLKCMSTREVKEVKEVKDVKEVRKFRKLSVSMMT